MVNQIIKGDCNMCFNPLIPELIVSDLRKSLAFYVGILHFRVEYEREEKGFAFISYHGAQVMLEEKRKGQDQAWMTGRLARPFGRGINFQIETDEVNKIMKRLDAKSIKLRMRPRTNWYRKGDVLLGCREILVTDPDGYLLRFSQGIGEKNI